VCRSAGDSRPSILLLRFSPGDTSPPVQYEIPAWRWAARGVRVGGGSCLESPHLSAGFVRLILHSPTFASTRALTSTFPCFLLHCLLSPSWDLHFSHSSLHLSVVNPWPSLRCNPLTTICRLSISPSARLGLLSVISLMIPPEPGSLLFGEPTLPEQTTPPAPHLWLLHTPTPRRHLR
jgi:hypothetical protein